MQEFITVIVNTEDVADKHRGWTGSISIGTLEKLTQYHVTLLSKYKLKNGSTRMKFVGEKTQMSVTDRTIHISLTCGVRL